MAYTDEELMAIANGPQFVGTTGRSAKNNNFLNIEFHPGWQEQYGAVPEPTHGGRFSAYPDPMSGYLGNLELLKMYQRNQIRPQPGGHTLRSMVYNFSPPSQNPTEQLVSQYSNALGVHPDTPLTQIKMEDLFVPMAARESSTNIIYPKPTGPSDEELMAIAGQGGAPLQPAPTLPVRPKDALSSAVGSNTPMLGLGGIRDMQAMPQEPNTLIPKPDYTPGISESLNQFQIPFPMPQPETIAGTAAGLVGPTKVTAPLTGLALAGTGALKRAYEGKQETYNPSDYALIEQGLPAVSNEMFKDFAFGTGLDALTSGVSRVAGKLLGFGVGKVGDVIQWARQNKIPVPADIAGSKMGKLAENLPDIGMGGMLTQLRRQKTAQGLTDAVDQVAKEVGLPSKPAGEVGQDVANILQGLVSGSSEHSALKKAFTETDQSQRYTMNAFKDAIYKIGESGMKVPETGVEKFIVKDRGFAAIERVYGDRGASFVDAVKEIADNNWTASPKNLNTLVDMVNLGIQKSPKKGWNDVNIERAKGLADTLKQGFVKDMEDIVSPTGQTLATLYQARNQAYKDAMGLIEQVNPNLKLLYKPNLSFNKYAVTTQESNFENMADRLFRPDFEKQALQLKDTLTNIGQEGVWDTAKMAWIKKAFDNSTFKKGDDVFFSPTKYNTWFEGNKDYITRMMPEQLPALQKWSDISTAFESDIKRFAQGKPRLQLGSAISGGGALISFATGGAGGIAVPQATSFLSALSVMPGAVKMYLPAAETGAYKALKAGIESPVLEYRGKNE